MSQVSFDDEVTSVKRAPQGPLLRWLTKKGIAKTQAQANNILIIVAVIAIIATLVLVMGGLGTETVPVPVQSNV